MESGTSFISYTQADKAWAEWIAWQLEEDGYQALLQAWDMVPGVNWTHLIQEGVQGASRTIAVLSRASLTSVFATAEWEAAWRIDPLDKERKLLVFRVMDCDRPGLLGGVVGVDLFGVTKSIASARIRAAARASVTGRIKPASEPVFPSETRAVAAEPRFPGTLPEVWNVTTRNANFTDRSAELGRLHAWLAAHLAVAVHALHGMGGVGKTQTAIEYAWAGPLRRCLITSKRCGSMRPPSGRTTRSLFKAATTLPTLAGTMPDAGHKTWPAGRITS